MNKKINFKKWDEGKAIYWICDVYLPINVKKQIIKFNWEDVSDEDAIKIKTKQAQIFHEECSRIVALWKDVFKSNLSQFNNKKKYIKNEMSDMRSILAIDENLNVVYYEKSFLNHKQLVFEKDSVNQVRHYFHDVILLDKIRTFDFIHSNNFKYQHLSKTPSEIYAQVCWNFYNWLQKINLEIEQRELFVKPDIEKIEPKITVEKKKIYSLISLFDGNKKKVGLIKKALNKLNITKDSSERAISGFVDASISANALPKQKLNKLISVIYFELEKPIPQNLKSRSDGPDYSQIYKEAKKYYGLI